MLREKEKATEKEHESRPLSNRRDVLGALSPEVRPILRAYELGCSNT